MAFNTNPGRQSFTATGGQTNFDFNFKIYEETDIKVYLTPAGQNPDDTADLLTYGSEYTVIIDGDNGGTVTLLSGATLNDTLVVERVLPRTRDVSYVTNGDLKAATLNEDQDYQTYLLIDDFNTADRSLSLPSTDVTMSPELPTTIKNGYLRAKADGTGFEYTTSTLAPDQPYINVMDYGAVADGNPLEPTSGTDNTAAIQAAIDSGNSLVFIPDGDYRITSPLELKNGSRLVGSSNSDLGVSLVADGCDAIHITAKDTTIENIRIYLDNTYWAFTYEKPAGQDSSFNNINRGCYVNNGGAFKLLDFSRSFIDNFNSNNLDYGVYLNGYSQNSSITDSLFQGHNDSTTNVDGEYGFKADTGSVSMEGISITGCKFISFYDAIINFGMRYSTFTACVFDVITRYGYYNSGFNKNITFTDCYFAVLWHTARGAFPTIYGYKSYIVFVPLASEEPNMAQEFKNCYFVSYVGGNAPDVIANIDLYNGGVSFLGCEDVMSGSNYSLSLTYPNKNCILRDNKRFKRVVSNSSFGTPAEHEFDPSNRIDTQFTTGYKILSLNREFLYNSETSTTASGTLTSKIAAVTSGDGSTPRVFKVYVREGGTGLSFIDVKEYLVIMSYAADASVNNGIQLVATSQLWNGSIGRVTVGLSSTAANTDKSLTFTWSSDTVVQIDIERIA